MQVTKNNVLNVETMHMRRVFLTIVARTMDIRGNYRLCFNYLNDENKILMDLLFWLPKKTD